MHEALGTTYTGCCNLNMQKVDAEGQGYQVTLNHVCYYVCELAARLGYMKRCHKQKRRKMKKLLFTSPVGGSWPHSFIY